MAVLLLPFGKFSWIPACAGMTVDGPVPSAAAKAPAGVRDAIRVTLAQAGVRGEIRVTLAQAGGWGAIRVTPAQAGVQGH